MVVDVIDLNFKSLGFSRTYDYGRESRARTIYNREKVHIMQVDKIDNDEYAVKASVEGNYDIYNVELSISGIMINKATCECEDYHKGNICKHLIATALEIIDPHYASTPDGRARLRKRQREEAQRRFEEAKKREEEERKRREYESKYYNGLRTINAYKAMNIPLEGASTLNLQELYAETLNSKKKVRGTLATNIKIEPKLEFYDSDKLKLTFKIGQTRMYVLSNLGEFYNAYKKQEELYYGKQLTFIPKKENFIEEAHEYFDLILEYAEMIEYSNGQDRYSYRSAVSNKEIFITGDKIEKIFDVMKGQKIIINSYHNGDEEYSFTDENLDVRCVLDREEVEIYPHFYWQNEITKSEEYVLRLNIQGYNVLYSNKYIYVFYNNKIYKMKKNEEIIQLLDMFENNEKILIPEDKLDEFKQFVAPKIKMEQSNNLPAEFVQEGILANKLASKILLDVDSKGNILLELKFCYPNLEFNILERNYQKRLSDYTGGLSGNDLVRDVPAETDVVKRIFLDGFELTDDRRYFILKDTDAIYDFLSNKIEEYMKDYEVLATDAFKNKEIKQPKISSIGVRIDNGLLEIDLSKINIDINEMKDILKDYNIKKKYHKLKSGDFLDLTASEDLDLLDEMMTTLDIDYSKMQNGTVSLPINRSVYLEKLLDTNSDMNVSKNENFTELINNFGNAEITDNIKIDEDFKDILRDYQKVGYKWLKTLEHYKFGGILADDMGLGKTLQIIALLKSGLKSKNKGTSIVVCPSTLVLNWKAEIEKWCKDISVSIIKGTVDVRKELIDSYKDFDLIITSYDLLKRDVEEYEGKKFKYIIADEAQYIKNSLTQNATSLKSLNGDVKFALTGTPIENSAAELWSIFDFIMPGYLYNYNKFKKKFEEPILKNEDKEALTRLKKLISPFILRRVKKDVLTELPDKNITIMKNEMEDEQEKLYLSYLAQTKKEIAEELEESSFEKSKFKILMLLTRLRQICCHPGLFIENYRGESGKLRQCIDLVIDAIEAGHKILLFSSYTSMFEIIEKELEKRKIKYFKLIGNTPVDKRIEMVDEFNSNEDVKVFLISLKAGGTGLNLTSADVVIHYDPWWNVSSENQATDRAYRIGQKNSVQVYKLITSNSIEEKINQMQERKEKLSKDLLSTEETFISKMSKEEILDLFE